MKILRFPAQGKACRYEVPTGMEEGVQKKQMKEGRLRDFDNVYYHHMQKVGGG